MTCPSYFPPIDIYLFQWERHSTFSNYNLIAPVAPLLHNIILHLGHYLIHMLCRFVILFRKIGQLWRMGPLLVGSCLEIFATSGSAGTVAFSIGLVSQAQSLVACLVSFLYLGIVVTHLKTVLIVASILIAFQKQCLALVTANLNILECKDLLKSFKHLKEKISFTFLCTYLTLTAFLILGSYDAYVVYVCIPEYSMFYILLAISTCGSSAALLLYLAQLAEDTCLAFTSLLGPIR